MFFRLGSRQVGTQLQESNTAQRVLDCLSVSKVAQYFVLLRITHITKAGVRTEFPNMSATPLKTALSTAPKPSTFRLYPPLRAEVLRFQKHLFAIVQVPRAHSHYYSVRNLSPLYHMSLS